MNIHKPLVSIVCVTYNHEAFISQCLDSFLMQKCNFDFEIVIHDDASTDNTANIIREYEAKHPNIFKPIYQKINQASQEKGRVTKLVFSAAKGKYIAFCEGDDFWTDPSKLQKQVDFLENNPDFSLTFTNTSIIDTSGNVLEHKSISENTFDKNVFVHTDMPIFAPTLTRVFKNVFLENEFNIPFGDTVQLVYLSRFGKIKYLDEVTATYRKHLGGVWSLRSELVKKEMFITSRIDCLDIVNSELLDKLHKSIILQLWNLKVLCNNNENNYLKTFNNYKNKITKIKFKYKIALNIVKFTNIKFVNNNKAINTIFKKSLNFILK